MSTKFIFLEYSNERRRVAALEAHIPDIVAKKEDLNTRVVEHCVFILFALTPHAIFQNFLLTFT